MSDTPSDVMRAWFRRVWNEGDESAIFDLFAKDGKAHGLGPEPIVGPESYREFWKGLRTTFDDVQVEFIDCADHGGDSDSGGTCLLHLQAQLKQGRATHPLEGFARCRIESGQIQECWQSWDWVTLLVEMGALPADTLARALMPSDEG